jgi:ribosomal protein S18 acetylase RimI-like enzyme
VNVRRAADADRDTVHRLYTEFFAEHPPPAYHAITLEDELREIDEHLTRHVAVLAEDDEGPAGLALARLREGGEGYLSDLYVRARARRQGVGKALLAEAAAALRERGATHVVLNVDVGNTAARTIYELLGFRTQSLKLVIDVDALEARVREAPERESFGSVHVQTDDASAVERAVRQFVPRLGTSAGTDVSAPRNGWVAVYDELCDREPSLLRRLARELSDRMGAVVLSIGLEDGAVVRYLLFESGRVADEYASLPEFHGPLPPGDVIAMRANPTVAARLTGADPARVRAAAPTAVSPSELPPPRELLAAVAAALGIEGAEHGYAAGRG